MKKVFFVIILVQVVISSFASDRVMLGLKGNVKNTIDSVFSVDRSNWLVENIEDMKFIKKSFDKQHYTAYYSLNNTCDSVYCIEQLLSDSAKPYIKKNIDCGSWLPLIQDDELVRYVYDSKGNWIMRIQYSDHYPKYFVNTIVTRTIFYNK